MVVVLEHVANLDGRARNVVKMAAHDFVVLRAELDVQARRRRVA